MIVNLGLRNSLSQDIRKLVTGRMTNDEFDDLYYEKYMNSEDEAISTISDYCWGLCSSDFLFPVRLKGRTAAGKETRRECARVILFLRSRQEYQWPNCAESLGDELLNGIAFLMLPLGLAFLFVGFSLVACDAGDYSIPFLVGGVITLLSFVVHAIHSSKIGKEKLAEFNSAGDAEFWPFLTKSDFEAANETCHLIAANSV